MRTWTKWTFASALAVGSFLTIPLADANPLFPFYLQEKLDLPKKPLPSCLLCHSHDPGTKGSAIKPLAVSLQRLGVRGLSTEEELDQALDQLEKDRTDSDGDGVGDIDEIRQGSDPNVDPNVEPDEGLYSDLPVPQTGCAVSFARNRRRPPAGSSDQGATFGDVLALIACSFLGLRLLRRKSERRG